MAAWAALSGANREQNKGENMGDTELHPAGIWGAFYRAIKNYWAFLHDAVEKGEAAAKSIHSGCAVMVSHAKAVAQLQQCGQALEREYWTAPIDGDMSGLETFCRDQARQFPAFGEAVKSALLLEVGGLSRRLHEEGLREPDVSSVKRAIHEGLLFDDREKAVEGFLYARAAMDWYGAVIADAGAPVDQAEGPEEDRRRLRAEVPGGFIGFCLEQIKALPPDDRARFLAVNRGDSTYYGYREKWGNEWVESGNRVYKNPAEGISKAKAAYRKLNKELKN